MAPRTAFSKASGRKRPHDDTEDMARAATVGNGSDSDESDIGPMFPPGLGDDGGDVGGVDADRVEMDSGSNGNTNEHDNDNANDDDEEPGKRRKVDNGDTDTKTAKKRTRVLAHESLYLTKLPNADAYERSLMHRDIVNFVCVSSRSGFVVTTSIDGHVKFWRKTTTGVEFVKHFRAHLGAIVAVSLSFDGLYFASCGVDGGLKVFDVVNFDMINMMTIDYLPRAVCWAYQRSMGALVLACSDKDSNRIFLYDGKSAEGPLHVVSSVHSKPVLTMSYNPKANVIVSVDDGGMLEYWQPDAETGFATPRPPVVSWQFKSDTDLYEFKKSKSIPTTVTFSPDFKLFSTFSFPDRSIRIFNFKTGKLFRKYDESLTVISDMQTSGATPNKLDDMEFGRRLALEREIEKGAGQASTLNVVFDESGNFIMYSTLVGIKIVNIYTNKVVRVLAKTETPRFAHLTLYQGMPSKKAVTTLEMVASENPALKESESGDPTLIATGFKKNRFYLFSTREPEEDGRDVFNEKPTREEQALALVTTTKPALPTTAILHTSMGDVHLQLYPQYAPKTVENFVGLAKKSYYDSCIFHRVIKSFMVQTGDPLGDGTGGESLWGKEFEDEFHPALTHSKPFMLSMANCGPSTNGSQFFITTAPATHLNNKHTVFGKCVGGSDVITRIEALKTDKFDRPFKKVMILGVEVGRAEGA